jgi:L-ribulose-5-phosphate 3-epimerase
MKNVTDRLAVCSWSLQPTSPEQLIEQMNEIGLTRLQIALDPIREQTTVWKNCAEQCASAGMTFVSGMFGCVGEDYTTMESIRRTGGIVQDETWNQNWQNIQATAQLAKQMGLKLVTFHAGFLPHDLKDAGFNKLRERLRMVADAFARNRIELALETGQETAATLNDFLELLERPNVGVNFDPANMILYDKGNPIDALRTLGPWLKQCHLKDAIKTSTPGKWGDEVVVGTGQVSWRDFFATLTSMNFHGDLAIEREAGNQRVADIRAARQFVESIASNTSR